IHDSSITTKILKSQLPLVSLSFLLNNLPTTQFHHHLSLIISLSLSQDQDQDQDQDHHSILQMTMSTLNQQVLALPEAKTAPSGYFSDLASINNLQIPTSSKNSEQIKKKTILRKKKTESFTNDNRDQNKLGPNLTETVKRKLSLGAKIIQMGSLEKIYKRLFRVHDEEKLFKAYQCYLSTTAGPIAGLLFISSKKIAFCSERSIKVASPQGDNVRVHYKVSIPLCKINGLNQSVNTKKPSQKYLEVVTADGFEFWFMGFLSNKKAYNCLEQALCLSMEQ
ncbi:unnamed protein product, partial [Brassica rapa subsp. narinosa]